MDRFRTLPKAELHLHVEGTLEPELAFELAGRNGVDLPFADAADLRSRYRFTDLQSFLDVYYATMAALRTEQDFADLATAYLQRARAQGVRHVEMSFDPQAHTSRGVALEAVVDGLRGALTDAERDHGTTGGLVLCIVRDRPVAEAMATVEAAASRRDDIVAIGLDSAEVGHPPALFADVFARARQLGWRAVAHAGEEGPPDYVRQALDLLRVERVDHGIRALEDPGLVERLRREAVPLTVCPVSNVRLGCVPHLSEHPLPRMLEAGLLVTVNSDDPAYFGGYVGDVFAALGEELDLDEARAAQLARNSVAASFTTPGRRAQLLAEIDAWTAAGS